MAGGGEDGRRRRTLLRSCSENLRLQLNTHLHQLLPASPIGALTVDDLGEVDSARQVIVRQEGPDGHQVVIATGRIHLVSVRMRLLGSHVPEGESWLKNTNKRGRGQVVIPTFSSRVGITTWSRSLIFTMG